MLQQETGDKEQGDCCCSRRQGTNSRVIAVAAGDQGQRAG